MINIIPRKENDGINLQWQPKQLSEEEVSTIELKMKEEISNTKVGESPKIKQEKKAEPIPEKISDEENYLIKQLRRIP